MRAENRKAKETKEAKRAGEMSSGLVDQAKFKQMEKDLDTELRRLKELGGDKGQKPAPKDEKAKVGRRPPNRKLVLKKPTKEENKPTELKKQVSSPKKTAAPRQPNSSLHNPAKAQSSSLHPKQAPNSTHNKRTKSPLKKPTLHNDKKSSNVPPETLSNLSDLEKQILNEDADEHFAKINYILNKQFLRGERANSRLFDNVNKPKVSKNSSREHSVGSQQGKPSARTDMQTGQPTLSFNEALNSLKRNNQKIIDLSSNKYSSYIPNTDTQLKEPDVFKKSHHSGFG